MRLMFESNQNLLKSLYLYIIGQKSQARWSQWHVPLILALERDGDRNKWIFVSLRPARTI